MWTSLKKVDGNWTANGKLITEFNVQWGENEPLDTPGADCAAFSKSKEYKLKASACFEQKHYLCMALSPDCPDEYTWLSLYGKGKSCFKVQEPIIEEMLSTLNSYADVTIADYWCEKEYTRPFVPYTIADVEALRDWTSKPEVYPALYGVRKQKISLKSRANNCRWPCFYQLKEHILEHN